MPVVRVQRGSALPGFRKALVTLSETSSEDRDAAEGRGPSCEHILRKPLLLKRKDCGDGAGQHLLLDQKNPKGFIWLLLITVTCCLKMTSSVDPPCTPAESLLARGPSLL